jgi:purine-binding chemotaxis protein CheW
VVRAVEVTNVPNSTGSLLGVIVYQRIILPVLNLRYILHLPAKEMDIDDRILILNIQDKQIAIVADRLVNIITLNEENLLPPDPILSNSDIRHIIQTDNCVVFLLDIENLIKHNDEQLLEKFMNDQHYTSVHE